jgi:hypothetical protein
MNGAKYIGMDVPQATIFAFLGASCWHQRRVKTRLGLIGTCSSVQSNQRGLLSLQYRTEAASNFHELELCLVNVQRLTSGPAANCLSRLRVAASPIRMLRFRTR